LKRFKVPNLESIKKFDMQEVLSYIESKKKTQ